MPQPLTPDALCNSARFARASFARSLNVWDANLTPTVLPPELTVLLLNPARIVSLTTELSPSQELAVIRLLVPLVLIKLPFRSVDPTISKHSLHPSTSRRSFFPLFFSSHFLVGTKESKKKKKKTLIQDELS
jgi:hypothetical protein